MHGPDRMTHGDHLVGADDGFEPGECVGRPVGIEDGQLRLAARIAERQPCLLYTSDAADERSSVDLGGRRIIKQKTQ